MLGCCQEPARPPTDGRERGDDSPAGDGSCDVGLAFPRTRYDGKKVTRSLSIEQGYVVGYMVLSPFAVRSMTL
jgi:hypothetical protein